MEKNNYYMYVSVLLPNLAFQWLNFESDSIFYDNKSEHRRLKHQYSHLSIFIR